MALAGEHEMTGSPQPRKHPFGVRRRRHRIGLAGEQQRGDPALERRMQIRVDRTLGPGCANRAEGVDLIRALIGARQPCAQCLGLTEQRRILAADHGVLHAACDLVAELARDHDRLRGERREVSERRLMNQHGQQSRLRCAVGQKPQRRREQHMVELDGLRQPGERVGDNDGPAGGSVHALESGEFGLQRRISAGAVGAVAAAADDAIERAFPVERRVHSDGLSGIGHAVEHHGMHGGGMMTHVKLRDPRAVRSRVQIDGPESQRPPHLVEIRDRRPGGVEAHPVPVFRSAKLT